MRSSWSKTVVEELILLALNTTCFISHDVKGVSLSRDSVTEPKERNAKMLDRRNQGRAFPFISLDKNRFAWRPTKMHRESEGIERARESTRRWGVMTWNHVVYGAPAQKKTVSSGWSGTTPEAQIFWALVQSIRSMTLRNNFLVACNVLFDDVAIAWYHSHQLDYFDNNKGLITLNSLLVTDCSLKLFKWRGTDR